MKGKYYGLMFLTCLVGSLFVQANFMILNNDSILSNPENIVVDTKTETVVQEEKTEDIRPSVTNVKEIQRRSLILNGYPREILVYS